MWNSLGLLELGIVECDVVVLDDVIYWSQQVSLEHLLPVLMLNNQCPSLSYQLVWSILSLILSFPFCPSLCLVEVIFLAQDFPKSWILGPINADLLELVAEVVLERLLLGHHRIRPQVSILFFSYQHINFCILQRHPSILF